MTPGRAAPTHRRSLLAAAVACALLATACGEPNDLPRRSAADASQRLRAAGERMLDARSARMSFAISAGLPGDRVDIAGRGTFTMRGARDHATATVTEGSEPPMAMEMISIGRSEYVRFPSRPELLPPGKRWLRIADGDVASTTPTPSDFFMSVLAGSEIEDLGREQVRSQPATHYRVPLRLEQLARAGGAEAVRKLRRLAGGGRLPVSLMLHAWVPEGGRPSRFALIVRSTADPPCFISMTVDILEYDVATPATPPPRRLVADAPPLDSF